MRTSKPIATISYNTQEFLVYKLEELVRNHWISDYIFINHFAEEDEKKNHIHLWIQPNKLIDTMSLQEHLTEIDPTNIEKPLKCIDFRLSKLDDWILYNMHYKPYLASKFESREFHYTRDDFVYHDEESFEDAFNHAMRGSDWARTNQILECLANEAIKPADLISSGAVPMQLASQLNAFLYMKRTYGTDRGGRKGHDFNEGFES